MQKLLPTDPQLEAFSLDYYAEVQQRFTHGMDRLSKANLLLECVDPSELFERLHRHFGRNQVEKVLAALERITEVTQGPEVDSLRDQLEALYLTRAQRRGAGQDTTDLDAKIVGVKRAQRQKPQLCEGEVLADRYRLLEVIGKGGFARVWQAFDRETNTFVAVKVLHSEQAEDKSRIERFRRGANQIMSLQHPHVVRVLNGPKEESGFHYFVMEYLPGGDLHRAVLDNTIDLRAALRAVLQVGKALAYAHSLGLIHRDVKPHNVLLDKDGIARLTDFDLVLARDSTGGTRSGAMMGTAIYAAPEALEDASTLDSRADLYSLGMVLMFVLHARPLGQRAVLQRLVFIDTLPGPEALRDLLRSATALDPDDRPRTLSDFCDRLERALWPQPEAPAWPQQPVAPPLKLSTPPTTKPHDRSRQALAGSRVRSRPMLLPLPTEATSLISAGSTRAQLAGLLGKRRSISGILFGLLLVILSLSVLVSYRLVVTPSGQAADWRVVESSTLSQPPPWHDSRFARKSERTFIGHSPLCPDRANAVRLANVAAKIELATRLGEVLAARLPDWHKVVVPLYSSALLSLQEEGEKAQRNAKEQTEPLASEPRLTPEYEQIVEVQQRIANVLTASDVLQVAPTEYWEKQARVVNGNREVAYRASSFLELSESAIDNLVGFYSQSVSTAHVRAVPYFPLLACRSSYTESGAIIIEVEAGSPFRGAGLKVGDIILGIDHHGVRNAAELATLLPNAIEESAGQKVSILVERADKPVWLTLRRAKVASSASASNRAAHQSVSFKPQSSAKSSRPQPTKKVHTSLLGPAADGSGGKPLDGTKKNIPEQLSMDQIKSGLKGASIESCKAKGASGVYNVRFTIAQSGRVASAAALGGTAADCVEKAVRDVRFPEFSSDSMTLSYPIIVR